MVTRIEAEGKTMMEPGSSRIDLNRADAAALRTLPGIGRKLASRIIDYRDAHGPFLFEEDITQVEGIRPALYAELADHLTVTIPAADELAGKDTRPLAETYGRFADSVAESADAREPADGSPLPEESAVEEVEELPLAIAAPAPTTFAPLPPDDGAWELELDREPEAPPIPESAIPMPGPVAGEARQASSEPAPKQRGGASWFWTALLGAVLGGVFGLGLSMLVFAGINGSVDFSRSVAMRQVNGKLSELGVKLDAVQGDVGILQGDVSGLRQRVEVLSGLTARMEQAEETLATFTKEIQSLEDETAALATSLADLSENVDTMSETLDAVKVQTEKATTFFGRLQELLQEIFTGTSAEPQSAAPQGKASQQTAPRGTTLKPEVDA